MLHLGCWKKSSINIFQTADTNYSIATRFISENASLFEVIDTLFYRDFPHLHKFYNSIQLSHQYFKSFTTCAINLQIDPQGIKHHRDEDDCTNGLCWVVPFGKYEKGFSTFPDLQLEIEIIPGDVMCFKSRSLVHGCTSFSGYCGSLVLFTSNSTCFPN